VDPTVQLCWCWQVDFCVLVCLRVGLVCVGMGEGSGVHLGVDNCVGAGKWIGSRGIARSCTVGSTLSALIIH